MEYRIKNRNFEDFYIAPLKEDDIDFLHNVIKNQGNLYTEKDKLCAKAIIENSIREFSNNLEDEFFIDKPELRFLKILSKNKKGFYLEEYVNRCVNVLTLYEDKIKAPIKIINYKAHALLIDFSSDDEEDDKYVLNCTDEDDNKYEIILYNTYGNEEDEDWISYGNIEINSVNCFHDPDYICLTDKFFSIKFRGEEIENIIANDVFYYYKISDTGETDVNLNMFIETEKFYELSDNEIKKILKERLKTEKFFSKISNPYYKCTAKDINKIYSVLCKDSDFYGENNYDDAEYMLGELIVTGQIKISIILPQ